MSELMAEVDEALKRERLEHIWKTYGNLIIGGFLCLILATGGYSAYLGWRDNHTADQTEKLIAAEGKADPAQLEAAAPMLDPGLRSIALLRAAGSYMERNDKAKALAAYKAVAKTEDSPAEFKALAEFMMVRLTADTNPGEALTSFETIAAAANNPYRFHARLEAALIEAHTNKNFKAAIKQLDVLVNAENIPPSLSAKANALIVLYRLREQK